MANNDEKKRKRLNIFIAAAVFVVLGVVMAIGGNVIVQDGAMELQQDLELSAGAELHTDTICNALGMSCKSVSNLVADASLWSDTDGNATLASGRAGIGTTAPETKLDVDGMIRTRPSAPGSCSTDTEGAIFYNASDNHFYGCNSTGWNRLD